MTCACLSNDFVFASFLSQVSLCKTLLRRPSLCLLDEPSNHLDRSARQWLANYLAQYDSGAMILVTHDVELLKSMDHIAEITGAGTLQLFKSCTYTQYLEQKQERAKAAWAEYERNTEKAAKLQAFVDRFGASATKASAAQSRVKQIEKLQKQGALDAPDLAIVQERFKPSLILPNPPRSMGDVLLSLQKASVGYTVTMADGSMKAVPLVTNVNLEILRGMKLLIRGPNGAGMCNVLGWSLTHFSLFLCPMLIACVLFFPFLR
jgi:ATP-binding cassette, subfamily F, member 3